MHKVPEVVCYYNGEFLLESQIKITWVDLFGAGTGVYDTQRTYNHVPFMWREHIDRLFRSLAYIELDPGITKEEMYKLSLEVLDKNIQKVDINDDFVLVQVVWPRKNYLWDSTHSPNVLITGTFQSLRYASDSKSYEKGVHLVLASRKAYPPDCISAQAKHLSRLNLYLASREAKMADPDARVVILDSRGCISEGYGYNILWVKDGEIFAPSSENVLPGISQEVVFRLAKALGIEVIRGNFTTYDLACADEIFITGTSHGLTPVYKFNEKLMSGSIPGPITSKLFKAFSNLVGLDIVKRAKFKINYDNS